MSLEPAGNNDPAARARDLFARTSAGVDQGMAFRLRRARQEALAPRPRHPLGRLLPAGAMVATALALGVAWWLPARAPLPPPAAATAETTEIERLLAGDEDPEMYAWLADAPVATTAEEAP